LAHLSLSTEKVPDLKISFRHTIGCDTAKFI